MNYTAKDARLSDCGRYRYHLTRELELEPSTARVPGLLLWIMLNPSTADAREDDPTIRRVAGFTAAWGYTRFSVVNLFAWRATDPHELKPLSLADAIGPDNDRTLRLMAASSARIICAWGAGGGLHGRATHVLELLAPFKVEALKLTKEGHPSHPLYIAGETRPILFRAARIEPAEVHVFPPRPFPEPCVEPGCQECADTDAGKPPPPTPAPELHPPEQDPMPAGFAPSTGPAPSVGFPPAAIPNPKPGRIDWSQYPPNVCGCGARSYFRRCVGCDAWFCAAPGHKAHVCAEGT